MRNAADVLRDGDRAAVWRLEPFRFLQSTCPSHMGDDVRETDEHIHIRCCKKQQELFSAPHSW